MSAAPVSRSSALPEIPLPSRRAPERSEPEQAFTLPPEPAERPRPRLDDDRGARESAEAREPSKPDDARKTTAADTNPPARRADDSGKDRKAAGAKDAPDKPKTDAGTEQAASKDAAAEAKPTEAVVSDKPVKDKTGEEHKRAAAALLDGVLPLDKTASEGQAAADVATQPVPALVPVPAVAVEFLALAALTLQAGEPVKPEGTATAEGKPEGQAVAASAAAGTAGQPVASAVVVPVPAAMVKADGQASAGGEAAAAGGKAGPTLQVPAAGIKIKADPAPGEAPQGDARTADGQAMPKETGEAGKAAAIVPGGDAKVAEATNVGQVAQADTTEAAAPAIGTQPSNAPVSPQAILAAGPQSLTAPQPPLTELDAAAQATAHAQAEAAHRLISGETGRATPLHVVPVEIGAQALSGNKRFDIRLDPAELGRIDVRLEISDKGEVSAKLTVDRVETLHMLQRDARTLERAFEQAGLKPSEGGIDMSLRDSSDQQAGARQQRQDDEAPRGRRAWVETSEDSALVADVTSLPRTAGRLGGVDLSI